MNKIHDIFINDRHTIDFWICIGLVLAGLATMVLTICYMFTEAFK